MVAYIIIIAIATSLVYVSIKVEEKTDNKLLIFIARGIAILFPAIIAGIRYNVGTDYAGVYKPLFSEQLSGDKAYRLRSIEIGYMFLNKLVVWLGGGFNLVMFLSSLITIIAIYIGLLHYKNKINVTLAFLLFMLLFFQKSLNLVRQMMAVGIVFCGFIFLDFKEDDKKLEDEKYKKLFEEKSKKKNQDCLKYKPRYKYSKEYKRYITIQYIKYIACVLVAGLLQRTSLVMLIIPFVREIYANPRFKVLSIASYVILLAIILNFELIGNIMAKNESLYYYSLYFKNKASSGVSIAYFIRVIPVIIPFFFVRKKITEDRQMNLLYSMTVIGCILLLLGYLTSTYGERLSYYFSIFQIVMFPYYIRCLKDNKFLYIASTILIILFNIAMWFYDYIYMKRDETVPYRTIFSVEAKQNEKNNNLEENITMQLEKNDLNENKTEEMLNSIDYII